jgi:ribonuclease HI
MKLALHIDGASRGNPGPAAAGVVVRDLTNNKNIHEAGYLLGQSTNNVAEYNGLIRGLDVVLRIKDAATGEVHIHSDSQLMVRQVTGEYRMKSEDLRPLLQQANTRLRQLKGWTIDHVLRDKNQRADELANMALDAGRDVILIAGDGSATSAAGGPARAKAPASSATSGPAAAARPAGGLQFTAKLTAAPGAKCPARCPAKTPFHFGPSTPAQFCIHAAQAVFDEDPTLWRESHTSQAQTQCPRCGVSVEIALLE